MSNSGTGQPDKPGLVITELRCGLGNQLFQYAVGRALAHHHKAPLKIDKSIFDRPGGRRYGLDLYGISGSIAAPAEIEILKKNPLTVFHRHSGYHPEIWQTPRRIYIKGFWTTEKYFQHIGTELRKELTPKRPLREELLIVGKLINQINSVSLHIRRTDYLRTPQLFPLQPDYYSAAIKKLESLARIDVIYIFSDDIAWAKQNMRLNFPTVFIEGNRDYEDLWLMTQCKNHIIANSTFSWWGAWLRPESQQTVVAPRRWFRTRKVKNLIPDRWHQV